MRLLQGLVGWFQAGWTGRAVALGIGGLAVSSAQAGDAQAKKTQKMGLLGRVHREPTYGTMGYGPPGLHPGFQGFGLGYHLGNGYGGHGLGVGAEGGFPFYGGPGYPHPGPRLNRHLEVVPFPFLGGPGGPSEGHPQYYGAVGPLVADQPVISVEGEPGQAESGQGFGGFTGAVPYPESTFAPFTAEAAAGRSSVEVTPARSAPSRDPGLAPPLGSMPR